MKVTSTHLAGLVEVEAPVATDARGTFQRVFDADGYEAFGLFGPAVHVNVSSNHARHTLRGLHYQTTPMPDAKIVTCIAGTIFDVAVDLRPESDTFGSWYGTRLVAGDGRSLIVPELFAHGFLTLEPHSIVHYTMSRPYVQELSRGVRWDDPALGIAWPAQPVVMSDRDASFPSLDRSDG